MRAYVRIKKPVSWSDSTNNLHNGWATPFMAIGWIWAWVAYFISKSTVLQVLEYARSLGVVVAVALYFYESGDRIKQKHYQAWEVINSAQGKGGNGGRIEALQELGADRVSLVGIDVSGAFLQGARLEKAHLARSRFTDADVRNGVFASSDMSDADLTSANFRECNCAHVSFRAAVLDHADFWGADLTGADLTGATLANTDLSGADLRDIEWRQIKSVKMANILGMKNAPPGFESWALRNGAVQIPSESR